MQEPHLPTGATHLRRLPTAAGPSPPRSRGEHTLLVVQSRHKQEHTTLRGQWHPLTPFWDRRVAHTLDFPEASRGQAASGHQVLADMFLTQTCLLYTSDAADEERLV